MRFNWLWLAVAMAVAAFIPLACGGGDVSSDTAAAATGSGGATASSSGVGFGGVDHATMTSLTIDPLGASIESLNGSKPTQQFTATAHYSDGTTTPANNGVSWKASEPQIGAIDGNGLYTASGTVGGVVDVKATFQGFSATTKLTVKIHIQQNPANADPNVQGALSAANNPDPNVVWAYPYDGTVWPRGLLPPLLMWNGGGAADLYLVHLKNPTFELEAYVNASNAPASRVALDQPTWQTFVDSSSGLTTFAVSRWDGSSATIIANHTWTIAAGSMRGTIYYWSNNLGRVLRIKPGAPQPDDFANQPPLNDPNQFVQSSCLMTCHSVSADGSTLISGGGTFGGSYDLKTSMPMTSLGGTWGVNPSSSQVIKWMAPAVSPNGKYVLLNAQAQGLAVGNDGTTGFLGMYTTVDGMPVPSSGLMGIPLTEPTWSPEGSRIAYVDAGDPSTWNGNWPNPTPGDLKVMSFDPNANPMAGPPQTVVSTGADPNQRIAWPTITPDGKSVLYSRTAGADTRTGNSDLYIASTAFANQEQRLAKVDGDNYPFAAGARDLGWNFEPSFAPVASGGYFWVVFTSRRTYGNVLTGDKSVVKQLWVAAIDQNVQPGQDPSHPAFHLTGQDEGNLAMRGFWALEPCKPDGGLCGSGTECCGGYCGMPDDAGGYVCLSVPTGCSQDGDKCNSDADCCGKDQGTTCINHVCSEMPPK